MRDWVSSYMALLVVVGGGNIVFFSVFLFDSPRIVVHTTLLHVLDLRE